MKLTVLGAYGPYPAAGGACSGYLLEHEGYTVLIDCGNGVLSRLQQFIEISELRAIIVSHLHSDHVSDLFILRYALLFGQETGEIKHPLPVYAPAEPVEEYLRLPYKNVYAVEAIDEGCDLQLGPFTFTFLKTKHSVPCFALAVHLAGEKVLVYSADTEYFTPLADFARGADLFLCEANYLEEDLQKGAANHLTARQAASLAREAGAGALLLTHLLPFRNPQLYLGEADRVFKNVEIAQEGMVYELGGLSHGSGSRHLIHDPDLQLAGRDDAVKPGYAVTNDAAGPDPNPAVTAVSGDKGSPAKWLELTVETDSIKASILAGRLEEEGIPVFLKKDEAAGSIYGLTVGPLANIRVFVPPAKIEQARRLLEEIKNDK